MSKIRPIRKNVHVKLVENKPKGELALPPEYETSDTLAEVISLPSNFEEYNFLIGDKIIFTPGSGIPIPDCEDEFIVNIKDIIAIVEGN